MTLVLTPKDIGSEALASPEEGEEKASLPIITRDRYPL